jgi:hypothetical protein
VTYVVDAYVRCGGNFDTPEAKELMALAEQLDALAEQARAKLYALQERQRRDAEEARQRPQRELVASFMGHAIARAEWTTSGLVLDLDDGRTFTVAGAAYDDYGNAETSVEEVAP